MKELSKFDKKIVILIMLIVLLVTSTYAWFTTNKNVAVTGMNVEVQTSGNIEISADAINWKTSISKTDLLETVRTTYANATNQIPSEGILPMSTSGIVRGGKLDMFFGQVSVNRQRDEYMLTATKETEAQGSTGKFIAFDVFFKVAKTATVYLEATTQIKSTDIKDPSVATGIENAARFAFLIQGNAEIAENVQNLTGATDSIIVEPNYNTHTTTAIEVAKRLYNISGLNKTSNAALEYYGINQAITEPVPIASTTSTYFTKVQPQIKLARNFFGGEDKVELFTLEKGITKVRVYMWVEGQDVDCEDAASGAIINFDLQLSI